MVVGWHRLGRHVGGLPHALEATRTFVRLWPCGRDNSARVRLSISDKRLERAGAAAADRAGAVGQDLSIILGCRAPGVVPSRDIVAFITQAWAAHRPASRLACRRVAALYKRDAAAQLRLQGLTLRNGGREPIARRERAPNSMCRPSRDAKTFSTSGASGRPSRRLSP